MAKTPEESAAAERRRAEVAKTLQVVKGEEKTPETTETTTEEKTVETTTETTEETTTETTQETVDTNNETIENNEATQQQLEADKAAATSAAEKARIQKRIDKLTAKNKTLEDENKALKAQIEAKPDAKLTEEEVERRANQKTQEQVTQREFANSVNRLFKAATKIDKNFEKNINELVEELGGVAEYGIPGSMIGILDDDDFENAGDILVYFSKPENQEEYLEIRELPIAKMGTRLARLSDKLKNAAKTPPKEISKTPAPIKPPGGNQSASIVITGKESMDDFIRKRNKMRLQRDEERKQGLRR